MEGAKNIVAYSKKNKDRNGINKTIKVIRNLLIIIDKKELNENQE